MDTFNLAKRIVNSQFYYREDAMNKRQRYNGKKKTESNLGSVALVAIILAGLFVFVFSHGVTMNIDKMSTVVANVGEELNLEEKVKATYLGIDVTKYGKFEGNVDTNTIGSYYVEYTIPFFMDSFGFIVNVVDTDVPVITLQGDSEVFVQSIGEYTDPGYTAKDQTEGDITSSVKMTLYKVDEHRFEMRYEVTDRSGNYAKASRMITIRKGIVYLTFDDGPSLDTTPEILSILEEKGVKATFFLVGYKGEARMELVRQTHEAGHTIGYHGYTHDYAKVYDSIDSVMQNFFRMEQLVYETIGEYASNLVRFPGGSSNTVSKKYCKGVMTAAVQKVKEVGLEYFDWNVDSQDAGGAKTAEEVYQNVISGLRSGRSNVVLMHDFSGNKKTVEALPWIIDYCLDNGYEIRVIDGDTTPVHHNVAN